ncbi:ribonuclease P protein component [Tengunoibacter tsumagoiensis]|uniref:Ribonuclease P protein component n=1 Tax=Tengunoibacter tsumagoiensis TaxID=2014871 RepID=A0A401ZWB5_9CHLR|nr:ribonuclease P protein component [Tengunoibacter tsumagoiensis]GCE11024.1 ribonuclease P protein component [Tengunoibacter tsumagoiensis]
MALQRALRLRKNSDFQRVRQQGRNTASRLLILAYAPNSSSTTRLGFVVSKRISKQAVTRNYIKRLLSEAIRPLLGEIPAGWDLVFSAKNPVVHVNLTVLMQDVAFLLRRARLLEAATPVAPERTE